MFLSVDEQTIIAQCTPRGSGALALIRICGLDAFTVANTMTRLASGKSLHECESHTIHYGTIVDAQGDLIDKVMVIIMRGPKTFTGDDTVEITCHNNQFIIESIIGQAILQGARLAQEGEFTKRAVLHGKMDLVQAEAVKELIHAQTQVALKKSLGQLSGSLSQWIVLIEKELLKTLALAQASFEFIDEEMEFAPQIISILQSVHVMIDSVKKTFAQQQQIKQGIRIALIGSVNAGKSSLFNALLNQDRAIVTPLAGTTRDVIEAGLYKNGNFWTFVDTAGLRQTDDMIEQEGIKRSFEEAQKADIVILAYDCSTALTNEESEVYQRLSQDYTHKIIRVGTKTDCIQSQEQHSDLHIFVSAKGKHNIDLLEQLIEEKIATLFAGIESPFLLNQRQYNLLLALETKLQEIEPMLHEKSVAYELLAIHINDAIACLSELSGKMISEAGMDMVFKEFCIGK